MITLCMIQLKVRSMKQNGGYTSRKLLRTVPRQITSVLKADLLWSLGVTGKFQYQST